MGNQVYEGGNGDDTIYGAYEVMIGVQKIAGGGGKDFISTEFYKGLDQADLVDLTIWGDWDYGTGAEYDDTIQYGDPRLEKKLWGDDD